MAIMDAGRDRTKKAGRCAAASGRSGRRAARTGVRGARRRPPRMPRAPPATALYKSCSRFPVSSVRHRKRQGRVGRAVRRGQVTKPCGYEIKSDAVELSPDSFSVPVDLLTRYTSRR